MRVGEIRHEDRLGWGKPLDGVRVLAAEQMQALEIDWLSLNATAVFQAGARSVDAIVDELGTLHTKIRAAIGPD